MWVTASWLLFPRRPVAAAFRSMPDAAEALAELQQATGVDGTQLEIVGPLQSRKFSAGMQPEQRNFLYTFVMAHALGATLGAIGGLLLVAVGLWLQLPSIASSPAGSLIALPLLGGVLGMLPAPLLALRPDLQLIANVISDALAHGRWVVIVRVKSRQESRRVLAAMEIAGHRLLQR